MPLRPLDIVKFPFWTLALATGAKSFRDNRVIGSPVLNRLGLHKRRAKLAHGLAWRRRKRLEHLVSAEDRAAFMRDGFVMKRDYLPAGGAGAAAPEQGNQDRLAPRSHPEAEQLDGGAQRERWGPRGPPLPPRLLLRAGPSADAGKGGDPEGPHPGRRGNLPRRP